MRRTRLLNQAFPWRLTLFTLLLTMVLASAALAQTTTSTLRGKIMDEQGNAFPTAEVVATGVGSGYTHRATAGADGSYLLPGLTPGPYKIEVIAPAYRGASRDLTLLVGQTVEASFRLRPDTVLTEEMTVIGSTPVEMETSEVATNVTRRQIENLPQNDRNFLNFANLAPGVVLNTSEDAKTFRTGAQGASATNVFIDGVSMKNDVIQGGIVGQDSSRGNPFPQNAIQEFRVITQNYSAEYQKASSGIITAVTKSGANQLTGDTFVFYQDKSLVDDDPLHPDGTKPSYERLQYGVSVGGPIIRDRMHFFGSYEANDQDREDTVTLGGGWQNNPALRQQLSSFQGTFVQPFRSDLAFGKISFQPTASQFLDWSGSLRKESDISGFGGQISREAAEDKQNDVYSTTLRHQLTANTWLNELSGSYRKFGWNPQPLNPGEVGIEYEGLLRIGGRDTEQDIGEERLAFRDDVTFSGLKLGAGNHTVKFGGNAEFLTYNVTKFFEENPRFFFREDSGASVPYKARYGLGDPDLSTDNEEYGLYGQDDWSINSKLTLNLGLRWDYETNMFNTDYVTPPEIVTRLSGQFPAKFFTDGNDREPKTDLFQPRLGFSYDIFENGKTVAFGGAGRYYDRGLFNNTVDERFRLQHTVGEFFFSTDGSPVNGQPSVIWNDRYYTREGLNEVLASGITGKPEVFLIENDTKVPYSNQWNLGVRQSLGQMVASATYAQIRSYNGFSFLWAKGFCCPQFDPAYSNVLISSDDIRTWYDAVYLTLDRPYTEFSGSTSFMTGYGFNVAYTYADAEQVGGDLFSLDLPTIADWPRYGTPGSQDHRVVANAIVGLPWGVRGSTLIQYSSGDKFAIHDFSKGFCTGCYVRKAGESPSWTTIDLRLDKGFNLGRANFGVIAEAFNILNEERYAGFEDFQGPDGVNPNLGKPNRIVGGSQRRFQFGVRVGF